ASQAGWYRADDQGIAGSRLEARRGGRELRHPPHGLVMLDLRHAPDRAGGCRNGDMAGTTRQSARAAFRILLLTSIPPRRFFTIEPQRQTFRAAAGFQKLVERRFDRRVTVSAQIVG